MFLWAGHIARMGLMKNAKTFDTTIAKPKKKTPIERTESRREEIIKGKLCK
jgi:hypothetical protein